MKRSVFALHVVQAEEGDCLLVQSGQSFILIDGGPRTVYAAHLARALVQLKIARLRLVVLSHVDGDHVTGLIDLRRAQPEFPLQRVWLNAFSALVGGRIAKRVARIVAPKQKQTRSVRQGSTFAGLVGNLPVNPGFDGGLVSVESAGPPSRFEGLSLRVVGPDARALSALKRDWDKWLVKASRRAARGKARPGTSVTNRSSIVLLARSASKTMLLTGDSRWDEVIKGLEAARVLDRDGRLHVDILKVQHHGSSRNAKREFFERVTANKYVISANGRYRNPDVDTLVSIVDAARGRRFELIVTNVPRQVRDLLTKRPPSRHGYAVRKIPAGSHFITVTP